MDSKETKELAEQNIALVHKFIDATNAWDFSALRELFDPEVTIELPWTVDPFPKAVRGIENVMKFMESVPDFAIAENLYDFDIVDVRVIPQPNVQLIHHRAPRVLSTPWQLLPPVDVAR